MTFTSACHTARHSSNTERICYPPKVVLLCTEVPTQEVMSATLGRAQLRAHGRRPDVQGKMIILFFVDLDKIGCLTPERN